MTIRHNGDIPNPPTPLEQAIHHAEESFAALRYYAEWHAKGDPAVLQAGRRLRDALNLMRARAQADREVDG